MSSSSQHDASPDTRPPRAPLAGGVPGSGVLSLPVGVEGNAWDWPARIGLTVYHALALLALLPWFFSWTGVVLAALGLYFYGTLGINLCYHRILTHRGLSVPKWLERTFVTLGVCCLQDTPARWIAIHRLHHQHADRQRDPHSPLVTLLWGHVGWVFVQNRDTSDMTEYERYVRDILKDPYYRALEENDLWLLWINLTQWLVYFAGGAAAGWVMSGSIASAVQFGLSVWLWGVIVRTVFVWHITWTVNSLAHRWGYRTYETGDNSRNNWLVGWISNGEGWHNNHHADPMAAAHGHQWWEVDVTWRTVQLLERVGLATKVVRPRVWTRSER
ncbi:MAG: fatty acid desaturase [Casimicrobiaceae bacterium]